MTIALALIVKGDDREAELLQRCLGNVSPFVDGIFVTRTQLPSEVKNERVAAVAELYGAHLSDFTWCHDFSQARNFNFSQVPREYDYILWCDADDMWRGLEKLEDTLRDHPNTDAFGFWYLYDWDEFKLPTVVHRKTMLVKNDGSVRWVGALHEDLEETRALDVQLVEGIERLHLTDKPRAEAAARRNVEIATHEVQTKPDDPRSYWNLANSQYGVGDYEAARQTFRTFIDTSSSDEEKYLAHTRLADVLRALGDRGGAVNQLQSAIGLYPSLPDAYLQLAFLFFGYGNMDKAEEYALQGIVKRPQVGKMIVFNPRDYDYNPMMLLAKIYHHKNRPDLMLPLLEGCLKIYPRDERLQQMVAEGTTEKELLGRALAEIMELQKITDLKELKAAIEALPSDLRSHPSVVTLRNQHFVKETSSGRDLVIYCGNTHHEWNPELFQTKGFGGSEEAVINLSRELAKLGWDVTVYNNCGHKPVSEDGVTYRPFWEWNYCDKQDVVILWRWMKPLDAEINAPKIFVDLHDVVPEGEFTPKRLEKVSKVFVKTNFHRSLFPNVPDEKFAIIGNGIDFNLLENDPSIEKDPYLIINTSSPDRSMDVLPKLFKEVKKRVPQAKMQWAYGWDVFKTSFANDDKKLDWMDKINEEMEEAGIENLGRLTQAEVGKLYQRAAIFAYPTEFAEIDCISVKKAQAAGCFPVTTDFGALAETNKFGFKVYSSKSKDTWNKPYQFHFGLEGEGAQQVWVDEVVQQLRFKTEPDLDMQNWSRQFEWPTVAKRWHDVFLA